MTSPRIRQAWGLGAAAGVLLAGRAGAQASRWLPLYRDAAVRVSLDTTRVALEGARPAIWARWVFATSQPSPGEAPYVEAVQHVALDCAAHRSELLSALHYDQRNVLVGSSDLAPASRAWHEDAPDTLGETVYTRACAWLAQRTRAR